MAWTTPRTWVTSEIVTASQLNTHVRDNLNAVFPLGSFICLMRGSTSVETIVDGRFLECNGVAVSRTTYAALSALLSSMSYPFGAGDGSTTFNLPDLRGRAPVGHGGAYAMGGTEGNPTPATRSPFHGHPIPDHQHGIPPTSDQFADAGNIYSAGSTGGVATNVDGGGNVSDPGSGAFIVVGTWFIRYV